MPYIYLEPKHFHIHDFIPLIHQKAKWNPNNPLAMCISHLLCSAYEQNSFHEPCLTKKGSKLASEEQEISLVPISPRRHHFP